MGVGPIPASALRDAAHELGLDEVDAEVFVSVARKLDQIYLTDVSKRTGEGGKTSPAQVSSRPMSAELFDAVFG